MTPAAAASLLLLLCLPLSRAAEPVVFCAHRGGIVEGIPENTLAAFRAAVDHGIPVIEIDLRATRDGHIVILHDATLDRTTNGRGPVSAMSLAEVRRLDAGHGQKVPTLEEALNLSLETGVTLLLDIKEGPGLDKRKVVRLVEKFGLVSRVIAGPRNLADLREFKSLNPSLGKPVWTTAGDAPPSELRSLVQMGVDGILADHPALLAALRQELLKVAPAP